MPTQPAPPQGRAQTQQQQPPQTGPQRTPKARVLMELQERAKLGTKGRPSDEVEGARFNARWEPQQGTLGVPVNQESARVAPGELLVVSCQSTTGN